MNSNGLERRHFIRFSFICSVEYRLKGTSFWSKTTCDNLSLGGIMLISSAMYNNSDELELKIFNPDIYFDNNPILNAKVIWSSSIPNVQDSFLMGLEFINFNEENKQYLNTLIEKITSLKTKNI